MGKYTFMATHYGNHYFYSYVGQYEMSVRDSKFSFCSNTIQTVLYFTTHTASHPHQVSTIKYQHSPTLSTYLSDNDTSTIYLCLVQEFNGLEGVVCATDLYHSVSAQTAKHQDLLVNS